jgi:hypothetical protein
MMELTITHQIHVLHNKRMQADPAKAGPLETEIRWNSHDR